MDLCEQKSLFESMPRCEGDVTCVCMPLETADDCGEKTGTFTRSCVFANDDMGRKVG